MMVATPEMRYFVNDYMRECAEEVIVAL